MATTKSGTGRGITRGKRIRPDSSANLVRSSYHFLKSGYGIWDTGLRKLIDAQVISIATK